MAMALAMAITDDDTLDFNFSDYTTTTDGISWNDWSPVADLEELSGDHHDFQQLIQPLVAADEDTTETYCNSASTDLMMMTTDGGGDSKGLRLVHLLTAAAEALSGETKSHEQLARVILNRLSEIVSWDSLTQGTNMERLAAHFTEALQGLLDGRRYKAAGAAPHHPMDFISALQLTQDMSPYIKFGHFSANQAILEAVIGYKRVHVVDYDIMEGIQWASLMQALVSREEGSSAPHLRITALSRGGTGLRYIGSTVQETGRRLAAFAKTTGLSFSFHQCRLDSEEIFSPTSLKLVKGEALVFNCTLHLSHFTTRSASSTGSVLSGAKTLNPLLITLVEDEVGWCSPKDGRGFVGRFMDSLHHYSAIYDSLEAGFPIQKQARALVERVFLGPKIAGTLARIYRTGEDENNVGSWAGQLSSIGFKPVKVSSFNRCQAKMLLGLFNDGYRAEKLSENRLVLSWKSRRLLSFSIWTCSSKDSNL